MKTRYVLHITTSVSFSDRTPDHMRTGSFYVYDLFRQDVERLGIDAEVIPRNSGGTIEFKCQEDMNLYMMFGSIEIAARCQSDRERDSLWRFVLDKAA